MSKYLVDIQKELNAIRTTPYGKTMRPNLADAIEKLNKRHNALSETFDNLVIDAGNSNTEVVDARNDAISQPPQNYPTLGERLDAMQQTIINNGNSSVDAIPDTIVKRSNTGTINTKQILNFQDDTQNRIGAITVDGATRELRHNHVPVGGGQQTAYDIWTKRHFDISEDSQIDTVLKRSGTGNITTRQILNFQDNAFNRIGAITLDVNTRELRHNHIPVGSNQQTAYDIWTKRNLPVDDGTWTPVFTAQNGGNMTPVDQTGRYHRLGNIVIATFNYRGQNPQGFNGQLNLTGLPFVNATGTHVACTIFAIRGLNVGSNPIRQISAYVRPNEARIIYNLCDINNNTSNIAVLEHSHLATTTPMYEFSGTVVYKINP